MRAVSELRVAQEWAWAASGESPPGLCLQPWGGIFERVSVYGSTDGRQVVFATEQRRLFGLGMMHRRHLGPGHLAALLEPAYARGHARTLRSSDPLSVWRVLVSLYPALDWRRVMREVWGEELMDEGDRRTVGLHLSWWADALEGVRG